MSSVEHVGIRFDDSASVDAFGANRVSIGHTLFDSKQLYDKQPLFWDEVINGTATSIHSTTDAATTMTVNAAGDYVIRQTKMRFNYQPGKSQKILMTGVPGSTVANVTKRMGYYNSSAVAPYDTFIDGIYLEDDGTGVGICQSKNGTPTRIPQSQWNIDKFDGTGPSGIIIDMSKSQIFMIDFEWLGVGRVRTGFNIDGKLYYAHEFNNANSRTTVYMSSPNHSIRYEIRSTGGVGSLMHICGAVTSEGGQDNTGKILSYNTGISPAEAIDVTGNTSKFAILGIRLKAAALDCAVEIERLGLMASTGSTFKWEALLNPTVNGTFVFNDVSNSAVQIANGNISADPSNSTVTGGIRIGSGYISSNADAVVEPLETAIRLGSTIAGIRDILVIAVQQNGTQSEDYYGSLSWRELS